MRRKNDITKLGMKLGVTKSNAIFEKTKLGMGKRTYRHGCSFDSTLEADFYTALLYTGHPFQWQYEIIFFPSVPKSKKFPLLSGRGILVKKMFVDFVLTIDEVTYMIDTKGSIKHAKEKSKVKYSFLKYKLYLEGSAGTHAIKWIETAQVKTMLKLAKMPDKRQFWEYFKAIPNF